VHPEDPTPIEDSDGAILTLSNQPPGAPRDFLAKEIVDAGFLELVRYGVRGPHDPTVVASLAVIDQVLKVHTPLGPCWRRYNHDGYGQTASGEPFLGSGVGRAWPLLTGERGHYELAAGRDVRAYLRALERFASPTGLLPEQIWDEEDRPDKHLTLGRPTGSAMPLLWAHAEYLKLLRSASDGRVFDKVPAVEDRYGGARHSPPRPLEIWKHRRQPHSVEPGTRLRVQASAPFRLHWSADGWKTTQDSDSVPTALGISYLDLPCEGDSGSVVFTFYWPGRDAWEGQDYRVDVRRSVPAE
jgi:glucoamylase